jgi:hypothetical protein
MGSCLAASQPVIGKPVSEENVPELPVQPGPEHVTTASEIDQLTAQNMELDVPERTTDPPQMRISSSSVMVGDIIKKQFVEKVMDEPKELGNMTQYPQKEAENDEEKAELDQLSSNQLSRARITSSNGLVLPLLMIMHDVISRDESDEAGEGMAKVDVQDTESCLCPALQMGSGTGPLYK